MHHLTRNLIACVVCVVVMLHTSQAMYGLCSTDWSTEGCFDNQDECKHMEGRCQYGMGDHGEGCICLKEVFREDHWEYLTLTKDHFTGKGGFRPFPHNLTHKSVNARKAFGFRHL